MDKIIQDAYNLAVSTNDTYTRFQKRWEYLLQSYLGGEDYRESAQLTKYQLETSSEYAARLKATPLDNHCRSVISVYVSFLFRENPKREFESIANDPALESFLKDADYDGRSLDNFMKEVSIWSSVFGHSFIMVTKPNIGAVSRGEELAQGVRPYLSILTPLTVTDWNWSRSPNGQYVIDYIKYIEDVNGSTTVIKEWTTDYIKTMVVDTERQKLTEETIEENQMGVVPVVIAYNHRSPVRGLGLSDISDIADHQRKIYNEYSEIEQSIRLNGHPALVKTPSVEAVGGAGAVISMPEDMDAALKPYLLSVSTDLAQIYASIQNSIDAIDKMANIGAVRAIESRTMSGVAMETEFQLLNAKLSEKADNLQLAEEHIWKLYAQYQGMVWDGEVEYPGSFNIRDTSKEIEQLKVAKDTATDPVVLRKIDEHILEWMGEEKEYLPFIDPNPQPGRLYPDGEEINANLPNAYQPATNAEVPEGQNCANCEYYKPGELYCTKFDAPVRAVYWCAKWEPYEE